MRWKLAQVLTCGVVAVLAIPAFAQRGAPPVANDPIQALSGRLDLEKYKATIKGLTRFGDRRQGTDRNRAAIDWIEAELRSYGCANTERLQYDYPEAGTANAQRGANAAAGQRGNATGGARGAAPEPGQRRGTVIAGGEVVTGPRGSGSRLRGIRTPVGANNNPNAQPDVALRELNSQPSTPGPREEVYCTKIGTTHPEEMYILSAHMDGIGWGEAANDNGSGTALVMELARIFSSPDVQTERSIRFILWNNEETGMEGSRAYVRQRQALQGTEEPPGSGRYPEPKWLGMIQHDMMLFDHGMPREDGTVSREQRPEADINIEFQMNSKFAGASQDLAWILQAANVKYAADYPATVGPHMTSTDSVSFQDVVAAISLREGERGAQIQAGWDPHWHQPTDVFATFSNKDFTLGLNAAQTTLSAVAQLAGASLKK